MGVHIHKLGAEQPYSFGAGDHGGVCVLRSSDICANGNPFAVLCMGRLVVMCLQFDPHCASFLAPLVEVLQYLLVRVQPYLSGGAVKRDDVPDKLRVDVLRTIGGLAGAAATTALVEYVASIPAKDARPSKREAQKLLDERGSKP